MSCMCVCFILMFDVVCVMLAILGTNDVYTILGCTSRILCVYEFHVNGDESNWA